LRYPTISLDKAQTLLSQFLVNGWSPINADLVWEGEGESFDLLCTSTSEKSCLIESLNGQRDNGFDLDQIEGKVAIQLVKDLEQIPIGVLDDPGFWRFLTFGPFWSFVYWREKDQLEGKNALVYVDARDSSECVLTRMYIRGRISQNPEDEEIAAALKGATDFWRSHLIRVQNGYAPELARSFVKLMRDQRMVTGTLRKFAKRLNRHWANVELGIYSRDQAKKMLDEIYEDN
jgi:hypothetical protein